MERWDIAIIGTGPAGLEAAITAKLRNKSVLLLGEAKLSPKIEKAHTVMNYLGLPECSGEQMQEQFLKQLGTLQLSITEDRINAVYSMGNYFALQGHKEMYEARTVILACGLFAEQPIPGEMENLGKGVSYCATCDAALYRGKNALVLGFSQEAEAEANFLSELATQVVYVPYYSQAPKLNENIQIKKAAKPVRIERRDAQMVFVTEREELLADGIFLLRQNVAPSQLVPGLKIEENRVTVNRQMQTNLPGLFACGDITGAPYQYIKAAGEGNVAALSAVAFLAE